VPGEEKNYDKEIEVCGHLWPGAIAGKRSLVHKSFSSILSYEYLWLVCLEAVVIIVAGAIFVERWNTGEQLSFTMIIQTGLFAAFYVVVVTLCSGLLMTMQKSLKEVQNI
jgi:ABC-type transport system involved in multi-copper enzyme maturation permease subunit